MIATISYPPIPIFELGPLNLSLHGLFAGLGFVAGAALMLREVKRRGFDADKVMSVLTWGLVASMLGARLFTVPAHMFDAGYGFSDAISITGDYSILGGYAGGIIGGLIRMRMLALPSLALLDTAAPGMAIGAVVGRIGKCVPGDKVAVLKGEGGIRKELPGDTHIDLIADIFIGDRCLQIGYSTGILIFQEMVIIKPQRKVSETINIFEGF